VPDNRLTTGRFQPGRSGNPGGRPRGLAGIPGEKVGGGGDDAIVQTTFVKQGHTDTFPEPPRRLGRLGRFDGRSRATCPRAPLVRNSRTEYITRMTTRIGMRTPRSVQSSDDADREHNGNGDATRIEPQRRYP
jgi:hypothetical protein